MHNRVRSALYFGVIASLLGGCASQSPFGAPGVMPAPEVAPARIVDHNVSAPSPSYHVLYRFGGGADGESPIASLAAASGTLYGTTSLGGKISKVPRGWGTVFGITTTGAKQMLYRFGGIPNGNRPTAGLIDLHGRLYGTTSRGGTYRGGTVFSIGLTGKEQVLHSFGSGTDGAEPAGNLINVEGRLYGVTAGGGTYGEGAVFSITASGSEQVVYSFAGGTDGDEPTASLLDVSGTLYGTTFFGGTYGQGTVFSVSTTGNEQVLHSFGGSSADGYWPITNLVSVDGTLYGTTEYGGTYHKGTVFSLTLNGTEHVLHSFRARGDGDRPLAGLVAVQHTLYGTTVQGGSQRARSSFGTIFSISTSGEEHVLHVFGRRNDGAYPEAGLIDVHGTLYGTTASGGGTSSQCPRQNSTGCGTVFALSL